MTLVIPASAILDQVNGRAKKVEQTGLQRRERVMLALLAEGKTHRQIARACGISECAIGKVLARLYQRVGATNAASAVAVGFRLKVLS